MIPTLAPVADFLVDVGQPTALGETASGLKARGADHAAEPSGARE